MNSLDRIRDCRLMSSHTPPALPLPLPRVSGPKLEPYGGTASADIDFIRYIGDVEDADSKVWKVSIDGHFYALKIVSEGGRPSGAPNLTGGSRSNKLTRQPSLTSSFLLSTGSGYRKYREDGPDRPTGPLRATQSSHQRNMSTIWNLSVVNVERTDVLSRKDGRI